MPYTATPGQSWSSFYGEVGDAAGQLGEQSSAWNYAMNSPYTTGAVIGVGSGVVAYGGAVGLTHLSIQYANGIGASCLAFCGTAGQEAARYAETLNKVATSPSVQNLVRSIYKPTDTIRGGTFGAVRNEVVNNVPTQGVNHLTNKLPQTLNRIQNIIQQGGLSQGDIGVLKTILSNAAKELAKITR